MEETGRVVAAKDGRVDVEVVPGAACHKCGASALCNWAGNKTKLVAARNDAGAKVGDAVVLVTSEAGRLRSAAAVFGIPAVGMVAGVLVGSRFGSDTWAAAGAGAGLLAGFGVLKLLDASLGRSGRTLPVAVRLAIDTGCDEGGNGEETDAVGDGAGAGDGVR